MSNESYGKYLSEVYDTLNGDIDYNAWADFIEKCFDRYAKTPVKHISEIACGTGTMSCLLSARGYSVTASDLSTEMLTYADAKAQKEKCKNLIFTCQDMRCFKDSAKAGGVICLLDSLNCLTSPKDIKMCFDSVYNALEDGGVFLFDVNSKYKFENIYADNAYILEDEGVMCAWQNFYNEKTKICDFYLTFFLEQQNGMYVRHDEELKERMYTVKSLEKYLGECGFEVCGVFSDFEFTKGCEMRDERLYFAATKKQSATEKQKK